MLISKLNLCKADIKNKGLVLPETEVNFYILPLHVGNKKISRPYYRQPFQKIKAKVSPALK